MYAVSSNEQLKMARLHPPFPVHEINPVENSFFNGFCYLNFS